MKLDVSHCRLARACASVVLLAGIIACSIGTPTPELDMEMLSQPQVLTGQPLPVATYPPDQLQPTPAPADEGPAPTAQSGPSQAIIVDNLDPGFRLVAGDWGTCSAGQCSGTPYGPDFLYADPACTDCRVRYEFTVPATGDYTLWTWWPWGQDRATDTPYVVTVNDSPLTFPIDQRNSGDGWFYINTVGLQQGDVVGVEISASASGFANADAVAMTPAGEGAPGSPAPAGAAEGGQQPVDEPAAGSTEAPPPVEPGSGGEPIVVAPGDGAIVIDHTCTDRSRIPPEWLEQARRLTVHFAHTSHGSQIISGLTRLAEVDAGFPAAVQDWDPVGLPDAGGGLRIYDGNGYEGDTYITPEMYWADPDGLAHTQAVVASGLFNVSMWSWCGQQSENSPDLVAQYLTTMQQLAGQYPATRFVLMTGHSDGTTGGTLARNNQAVRDYALAGGWVLFDFEDIDTHDPDGNYTPNDADGACTWCESWCAGHPGDCAVVPDSCAHSENSEAQRYTCTLKANAFWWMLARLAGWDGN